MVALCVVVSASAASASVVQTGSLATTGPAETLALAGPTLAVGTVPSSATSPVPSGTIDVFSEGAGGWGDGALVAQLTASNGVAGDDFGQSVATDGATIVALADQHGRESNSSFPPSVLYLFSEPSGGWSGTMHESARLVSGSSTCTELSPASVSGPTVAATCSTFGTVSLPQPLVFSEPAAGWAGTTTPSAELSAPSGEVLNGSTTVTDDGRTILAGANCASMHGCVLVYREPAQGWVGTVSASARLILPTANSPSAIAVSGNTVFAAPVSGGLDSLGRASVYVFSRPGSTWPATLKPVATLAYPSNGLEDGPSLAVSGSTVAVGHSRAQSPLGCPAGARCLPTLDLFGRPKAGWTGTLARQASAKVPGAFDAALQGQTVLTPNGSSVEIAEERRPPAPIVSPLSVVGLAANRPHLRFNVSTADGPQIVAVRVALPDGLRFKSGRKLVAAGLSVTRRHTIALSTGKLTVTLRGPKRTLGLTIGPGAITESPALRQRIQRDARAHRSLRLTLTVTVSDSAGDITSLTVRGSAGTRAAGR